MALTESPRGADPVLVPGPCRIAGLCPDCTSGARHPRALRDAPDLLCGRGVAVRGSKSVASSEGPKRLSHLLPRGPSRTASPPSLRVWVLCPDRSAGAFLVRTILALTIRAGDPGQRRLSLAPHVAPPPALLPPLPLSQARRPPQPGCRRLARAPAGRR